MKINKNKILVNKEISFIKKDFELFFPKLKKYSFIPLKFLFAVMQPKFGILYFYRKHRIAKLKKSKLSYMFYLLNHYLNSCEINSDVIICEKVRFFHPIGIIIGGNCFIGKNTIIMSNVTIGTNSANNKQYEYPKIGNDCYIGSNTTIIGNIEIGNNVIVGANSFINKDVPDNCIVAGVPFKIIKREGYSS